MTMQVDKARLGDGQSFEWKGKTYYRGPLVEYGTFGSSRKISLTPFPSVCPTCGDRSLRSTEGKEVNRLREALRSVGVQAENAAWNIGKPGHKFGTAEIQAGYFNIRDFARAALTRSPE